MSVPAPTSRSLANTPRPHGWEALAKGVQLVAETMSPRVGGTGHPRRVQYGCTLITRLANRADGEPEGGLTRYLAVKV